MPKAGLKGDDAGPGGGACRVCPAWPELSASACGTWGACEGRSIVASERLRPCLSPLGAAGSRRAALGRLHLPAGRRSWRPPGREGSEPSGRAGIRPPARQRNQSVPGQFQRPRGRPDARRPPREAGRRARTRQSPYLVVRPPTRREEPPPPVVPDRGAQGIRNRRSTSPARSSRKAPNRTTRGQGPVVPDPAKDRAAVDPIIPAKESGARSLTRKRRRRDRPSTRPGPPPPG